VYHVHLDDATGDSCDCLGHIRWGHKTVCKHVAGIKACLQAGRI
jgi:predicted nucleic acid-binding Zn finger protein